MPLLLSFIFIYHYYTIIIDTATMCGNNRNDLTHLPALRSSVFFMYSNVFDGIIRCDDGTGYNAFESDMRYQLELKATAGGVKKPCGKK